MKEICLSNKRAKATFNQKGAELCSFILDGTEYIWQADPSVWNRHAPVLFPIVGRLKEDTYLVKNKTYHLSQHGFARDTEFELFSQSETSVSFMLESDPGTLDVYPFSFRFYISYTLIDFSLEVKYRIENPSEEKILFSVGGHPAFNCPLNPDQEVFEDYEIEFFDGSFQKEIYQLKGPYLSHEKKLLSLQSGKLNLSYDLFKNDALIVDSQAPFKISVKSKNTGKGFSMEYKDFRWLGIWTKEKGAGFICLEPWNGMADTVNHDQHFERKSGINTLLPGEKYEVDYLVNIF